MSTDYATINGIRTRYRVEGGAPSERPWLMLSHSLACSLEMWDEQATAFADRFTVLRYDTRGHGESEAGGDDYTLGQLAEDAKGLLDHLGVTRCHFVGLSMGGMIGQTMALAYPGLFQTLTVVDSTSYRPPSERTLWQGRINAARAAGMPSVVDATLSRWFTPAFKSREKATMTRVGAMIRATSIEGFVGCCRAISVVNTTGRLPEIKIPVLVMVGAEDHGTPPSMSRVIHESIAGSEMVIIPEASHICNIEQAAFFNRTLGDFLVLRG
jgi:3-oxoadipate enol-lactonase